MFYGSNSCYAVKTIVKKVESFRKNIQSSSHFTYTDYNNCLRSVNLIPISYQPVNMDLVLLNKLLASKLLLQGEQFCQIRNRHPKT